MRRATRAPQHESSVVHRTRELIRQQVLTGRVYVKDVARSFNMSQRALQRRLEEQGSGVVALFNQVRLEVAEEFVRNGTAFNDVAKKLDFSAQSAFHRGFGRRTGMTPGQYQRMHARGKRGSAKRLSKTSKKAVVSPRLRDENRRGSRARRAGHFAQDKNGAGAEQNRDILFRGLVGEIGLVRARELLDDLEVRVQKILQAG